MERATQLQLIREWCAGPRSPVLFDEPSAQLFDVFAAKTLALDAGALSVVERRTNRETQRPYLLLVYDDGRQLALTDAGIAFAPRFDNSGPLTDLPEAVCFRDFIELLNRLKHELYGHGDRAPTRDTVKLLMMSIAIVDGARAQRFDVSREEKELEAQLIELEKRAPPKA